MITTLKSQINNGNILPIHAYKDIIVQTVFKNAVTVICGETGSGKTTQVPQFLYPYFKKILISQPRRISAITLAQRVAGQMKVVIGQEIGYNVRFEQKKSASTHVTFVTDGMAIRQLMLGVNYDLFILDEAHERSINTDVLMAILKKRLEYNQKNKKQRTFKMIIMSATIESSKFMRFFNTDALINVEGRSYPTEVYNLFEPAQNYVEAVFNSVLQICYNQPPGDVLAFLTGEDQIVSLHKRLQKVKQQYQLNNIKILMLYSALPHQYQHQVFDIDPTWQHRKIILATNIAETSITIPGVRYVVDCGFMKIRTYDNHKFLDMLTIVPISKANALQRAGRAGRQDKGKCFRLYLKNNYQQLKPQTSPQILRSQLSGPLLQLKAVGIPAIKDLQFMDQPPSETIDECLSILREIKCLTKEPVEQITEYGLEVSRIPLPPRLGHLLLLSLEFKCQGIMLSMLSILSIENLFVSTAVSDRGNKKINLYEVLMRYLPTIQFNLTGTAANLKQGNPQSNRMITSDHLSKINILHEYVKAQNKSMFCKQNFINKNNIKRAVLIRDQLEQYLLQIVKDRQRKQFFSLDKQQQNHLKTKIADTTLDNTSVQNWLKCMQKGCFYVTAKLNKEGKYTIFRSGQVAHIHPESICFYMPQKPTLIVFSQVVKTNKVYMKDITPLPQN